VEWLLTLATAAGFLALFAASEAAFHRGIPADTTRRLTHVAGAGAAATFPWYLQLRDVVLLACAFTTFLAYTWIRASLNSIHGVTRPSAGALFFPIGLGCAALVAWGHPIAFAFGALVLALADPAAGAMGVRITSRDWRVLGDKKSLNGSLAHFVVVAGLGTIFGIAVGDLQPVKLAAAAGVLTVIEGSMGYGLDNLLLPLTAAVLGETLLSF
jgi:dolichol kinase